MPALEELMLDRCVVINNYCVVASQGLCIGLESVVVVIVE